MWTQLRNRWRAWHDENAGGLLGCGLLLLFGLALTLGTMALSAGWSWLVEQFAR